MKVPIKSLARVKHVGSLNASDKRRDSQEGAGLSVSRHPEEWREIARGLVFGDTWDCARKDGAKGRFMNVTRLSEGARGQIRDWAVANGLAEVRQLHFFSYYDDEMEAEMVPTFETEEEMLRELDDRDDAETGTRQGLAATDLLREASYGRAELACVDDLVAVQYAARETDLDGCWWDCVLDPLTYQAPRGVILPSRIAEWSFAKIG